MATLSRRSSSSTRGYPRWVGGKDQYMGKVANLPLGAPASSNNCQLLAPAPPPPPFLFTLPWTPPHAPWRHLKSVSLSLSVCLSISLSLSCSLATGDLPFFPWSQHNGGGEQWGQRRKRQFWYILLLGTKN